MAEEEKAKKLLTFLQKLEIGSNLYKDYSKAMTNKKKDKELLKLLQDNEIKDEEVFKAFQTRDLKVITEFLNGYLIGTGEGAVAILIVIYIVPH